MKVKRYFVPHLIHELLRCYASLRFAPGCAEQTSTGCLAPRNSIHIRNPLIFQGKSHDHQSRFDDFPHVDPCIILLKNSVPPGLLEGWMGGDTGKYLQQDLVCCMILYCNPVIPVSQSSVICTVPNQYSPGKQTFIQWISGLQKKKICFRWKNGYFISQNLL